MINEDMTSQFIKIRSKKRKIKEFLKDETCKDTIKGCIDNRCLKLISIHNDSIVFKANKKLRDYNKDMFYSHIYEFLSVTLETYGINVDKDILSLVTEISYNEEDYRIIVEL